MRRPLLSRLLWVTSLLMLVAVAGCAKKKVVDRRDFQEVNDYVDKNLHGPDVTTDRRRSYVLSKLGAAHRTSGESMFWYSPAENCYYLQMGADGWTSWGTGVTSECSKYAVTP